MGANQDFLSTLRAGRCSFYLSDFHVHSPASFDVRLGNRFDELSEPLKTALTSIDQSATRDLAKYEKLVAAAIRPEIFLAELAKQRAKVIGEVEPDAGLDWAVVAITDHNVCGYSCAVAEAAFATRARDKLVVLPGIELDIEYPCPETQLESQVHVLCIFAPCTSPADIQISIREAGDKDWTPGTCARVTSLPLFIQSLRQHKQWPAICIAAHVSSGKGVQRETKATLLTHLDAELSRLEGEKRSGKDPDIAGIERQMDILAKARNNESIALTVLKLIGDCGFDALQVASTADAVHYRRLHRFRDGHGRASPVVASDAHRPEDVFRAGEYFPHLKLPPLNSSRTAGQVFADIRRALRHGETRFSASAQSPAQYWIAGIEIIPDAKTASNFWPHSNDGASSFVLPLSRNLNTIIGGRGSGKSAAIEAIAFLAEPDRFKQDALSRPNERPESYRRAEATLSGCRIKLCWQFTGGELAAALPKRALIGQRYFDPQHQHEPVEYLSAGDLQLVPQQIPPHSVQIFRLGEIEKQAGPARLRQLFDKICGPQIEELDREIKIVLASLDKNRIEIIGIAEELRDVVQEGSPLREYAARRRLYEEVNTPELKEAYGQIDDLESAADVSGDATKRFSNAVTPEDISSIQQKVITFFDETRIKVADEDGTARPHLEELLQLVSKGAEQGIPEEQQRLSDVIATVETTATLFEHRLGSLHTEIGTKLTEARNRLTAKGLPIGSKDREAKRNALNESEAALSLYRDALSRFNALRFHRAGLRSRVLELSRQRSSLRLDTAADITRRLEADLDADVIQITADAQSGTDRTSFRSWLTNSCKGNDIKFQAEKVESLLGSTLTPDRLRDLLMGDGTESHSILMVKRPSAALGDIDTDNAQRLAEKCRAVVRLQPELTRSEANDDLWASLPEEIQSGLLSFPGEAKATTLNNALLLDEIVFDDTPVIRLNDRPRDPRSTARPVEQLSPGQRCSAVLPILLLTGNSPLIIDQPEDNLDNRLIRQVIVNILASIKLRRQVIVATHNPNLPVLGDVESAIVLRGVGDRQCQLAQIGDLDSPELAHDLTEVMEGGREAFQYRHTIYANHWTESVTERV